MKIRPIIFGATGMVGEGVLHEALEHSDVESVLVIGRTTCNLGHPKLREILRADFFDYTNIGRDLRGYDVCFFCLGVSSVGMNETEYTRVTYNLTMEAARALSRANPGMTFCYVSGMGTDGTEAGRMMWARVKGKTENDLMKLPFKSVYMFRPGFIKPTAGLHNAFAWAKAFGLIYPFWRLIAPAYVCTLEDLGTAMIHAVTQGYPMQILENVDIARLARSRSSGSQEE